jgi:hypothetical protein
MRRPVSIGLCGFLALALPLTAWAQSTPNSPTLTPGEMQALMDRLAACWAAPAAAYKTSNLVVTVQMKFAKDGSLAEPPKILNSDPDPRFAAAARSVIAALTRCAPFSFLPPAKYQAWKEISIDFEPRAILGDKPR